MRQNRAIAPLASATVPRRHLIIDTEAHQEAQAGAYVQTWALGRAVYLSLDDGGELVHHQDHAPAGPREMWALADNYARGGRRLIVWAHNLAYDLRISRALIELPLLGWRLAGIVLERPASWAAWRKGHATILCCDLTSWLPAPLGAIASDLGLPRPVETVSSLTPDQLACRCERDVDITAEAVMRLMSYLAREDLGPFRPTGAGQSHAAWRCRFLSHPPVVHDDAEALGRERLAMWTGRCEAWQWGEIKDGPSYEYDLQLAYCHIAADRQPPCALHGQAGPLGESQFWLALDEFAVLADVSVHTSAPIVPALDGERIHWPVGLFDTVLWDPEIAQLYEAGAGVVINRVWLYRRGPVLRDFAGWVLDRLEAPDASVSAWERRLLKHWSRTMVGRMALRYREWQHEWTDPDDGLELGLLYDFESQRVTDALQVGHDFMSLANLAEAESSMPMVTGWVMSKARAALWHLMESVGAEHLCYVDTDSLLVDGVGAEALDYLIDVDAAGSLVRKGRYGHVEIFGPRNLIVGEQRRTAGIPLSATPAGPGGYEGEVWSSIKQSMTRGELDRVTLIPRRWRMSMIDPRRHHNPDGTTSPHKIGE